MKKLITILFTLLTVVGYSQEYEYLYEVETKLIIKESTLTIDFDRVMIANIVLVDIEGEIVDKFTNYKTSEDLILHMKNYGFGVYYLYIQWNNKVAVKRISVRRYNNNWVTYHEQYKVIIK